MVDIFNQFVVDHKKQKEQEKSACQYYACIGDGDHVDEDGNYRHEKEKESTLAKSDNDKFFIKVGLDNRAYNPIGMFSEGQRNKILSKIGKKEFNFKRVNKRVFELYLSFLKTKNIAWLNNTNRELT
jgi:hypothetical protein